MKETKLIRQKYPNPKYMDITNSVNLGSFIKKHMKNKFNKRGKVLKKYCVIE